MSSDNMYSITWPTNINWAKGVCVDSNKGTTLLEFFTTDNGEKWFATKIAEFGS